MKKFFTFVAALAVCAAMSAEELIVFSTELKNPEHGDIGLCGLGMSSNGNYVCGILDNAVGVFIADVETGEVKWQIVDTESGSELRSIDNNGKAVGYGPEAMYCNFADNTIVALPYPSGVTGSIAEDITTDGSIIVGSLGTSNMQTKAAYLENGKDWIYLPTPTEEELGGIEVRYNESSAKRVSADGSVIFGCLGSFSIPIVWYRQADGTYKYDFFPARFVKTSDEDRNNPDKPLFGLSAITLSMSDNGRYLCMMGSYSDDATDSSAIRRNVPVIYDTQTSRLIIKGEKQDIDMMNVGLYPSAISNNGTIIGIVGEMPYYNSAGAFIWYADKDYAELYSEVFLEFATEMRDADSFGFNIPTGISADGSHILGYVFNSETFDDVTTPAYWQTYVIVTEPDKSGVEEIADLSTEVMPDAYFNIEGQRLNCPRKGLNIIRMSDGSSRKLYVK